MTELYETGRQLGQLLRGLVGGLGEQAPPPAARIETARALAPTRTGAIEPPEAIVRPPVFGLLLALLNAEHTGVSLLQGAAVATQGYVTPGPGTMYRALQRLRADDLIEQVGEIAMRQTTGGQGGTPPWQAAGGQGTTPPAPQPAEQSGGSPSGPGGPGAGMVAVGGLAAERRQSFRITAAGRQALQEQASLIIALAEAAQRAGFRRLAPSRSSTKPYSVPEEFTGLLPHLIVNNAAAAADFYKAAFDADELWRDAGPDGRIWHLEMLIRGTRIPIADEFSGMRLVSPTRDGNSVIIHQYVYDVDAAYDKAVAAGAQGLMPPIDGYWGDRYSQVQDPFGHRWALASRIEDLSPEQQRQAARAFREQNPDLALEPPM